MSNSSFPSLTIAENEFYTIVWTPMIAAGESWIDGEVPFLALPVFHGLSNGIINGITDAIFNQFRMFVDMTAIKLVSDERQRVWASESEKLAIIAKEEGVSSDAYQKALAKAAADFAALVHTG